MGSYTVMAGRRAAGGRGWRPRGGGGGRPRVSGGALRQHLQDARGQRIERLGRGRLAAAHLQHVEEREQPQHVRAQAVGRRRRGGGGLGTAEERHGVLGRGRDRERAGEARDVEHRLHHVVEPAQDQAARVLPQLLAQHHEHAQARAGDEVGAREVHDQVLGAGVEGGQRLALELRGGLRVHRGIGREDADPVERLDLDVHQDLGSAMAQASAPPCACRSGAA
jgi:hypothetical protein